MDAGSSRHYTSHERLLQLRTTEDLFNEGLYTSALLITGIHLCTVSRGEQWFECRALERYARCLTRLKHHKRSLEYYRRSLILKDTPLPADIVEAIATSNLDKYTQTTNEMEDAPSSPTQPHSVVEAALKESNLSRRTMERQKQSRDQIHGQLKQMTSKLKAQTRNAAIAAAARRTTRFIPVTAGLTNNAPSSIPPVVIQSETMRNHLASRTKHPENLTTRLQRLQDEADMDLAQSCLESGDLFQASDVFERIPEGRRTVKMYMFLVQLARKKVDILSEKACWESIAEMQPLAIEAYIQLLRAQVPLAIVLNMIPSNSPEKSWMKTYLQGIDCFLRLDYQAALADFAALDEKYKDNIDINLRMALCFKWMGKTARSCLTYSLIRRLDSHVQDDMYHYGICLKRQSKLPYLNKLASDLMRCNEHHPDAWCVQALYWDAVGDKEKAMRAALRAIQLDPDHCGALQLRGQLTMGSNNAEALNLFREAYRIDKDLITYEGLVNTYILMKSHMEALELAREAKRLMPDSAHALAIYGMAVYYLGDNGLKEALSVLQEALRMDPGCVEAATHLVTIYEAKGQHQEALEILDQQIDYQAVDKVYEKKAEIYTSLEQWEQALASYRNALSANPLNAKAKLGMAQVEKILSGGDEDEEDEAEASDHDERDMEAMDADPDQHGSVRGNMDASVQMGDSEYVDDFDHTPPPDSFIQSQLLEGDETFDRTPPPPPQQQRPPPTPQLPPRRIAPGTAVGSIISGSLAGPRLGSPTPGHRQAPGRLPNVSNVSRYEQEFNEHQETREEMDE